MRSLKSKTCAHHPCLFRCAQSTILCNTYVSCSGQLESGSCKLATDEFGSWNAKRNYVIRSERSEFLLNPTTTFIVTMEPSVTVFTFT